MKSLIRRFKESILRGYKLKSFRHSNHNTNKLDSKKYKRVSLFLSKEINIVSITPLSIHLY